MKKINKVAVCIVLSTSMIIIPLPYTHSYANPNWGVSAGKVVVKVIDRITNPEKYAAKKQKEIEKVVKQVYKQWDKEFNEIFGKEFEEKHKETYQETHRVLNGKLKEMPTENLKGLKHILDDMIKKDIKDLGDRDELIPHIKNRVRNKKLIGVDHGTIRKWIEEAPDLTGKSNKEIKKVSKEFAKCINNPYSDANYQGNTITVMPIPNAPINVNFVPKLVPAL